MANDSTNKGGFSEEEKAAMKARAKELAAEKKNSKKREEAEKAVLAAIDAMEGNDQIMARKIHELVTSTAPDLWPKTWYGMPAYAKDGKVICFFQAAGKFKARYATLGFDGAAQLDDGQMWATAFALVTLGDAEEKRIVELVKKAVG